MERNQSYKYIICTYSCHTLFCVYVCVCASMSRDWRITDCQIKEIDEKWPAIKKNLFQCDLVQLSFKSKKFALNENVTALSTPAISICLKNNVR